MIKRLFLLLTLTICISSLAQAQDIKKVPLNDLLFKAVYENNLTLAQSAINKGAEVNNTKDNLLKIAIDQNNLEMLELLLSNGANPNQYINEGAIFNTTPLLKAIDNQNIEIIDMLVKHGANVNQTSYYYADEKITGKSPLMYAVFLTQNISGIRIVEYLLKNDADVNYATSAGYTVLMTAANCDEFSRKRKVTYNLAKKLIREGANVDSQTKDGKNALDFAKEQNYTKMVELLSDITEK